MAEKPRRTKDPTLALKRLCRHLGATLNRVGTRAWTVTLPAPGSDELFQKIPPRSGKRCLAAVVDFATTSVPQGGAGLEDHQVREVVRLYRTRSLDRGLKAHEEATIHRVLLEEEG